MDFRPRGRFWILDWGTPTRDILDFGLRGRFWIGETEKMEPRMNEQEFKK